jgi:DNA-binding LytR/AlgR family response regulator
MIKAIIADTEPDAVGLIESLLGDLWPDLVVCGTAASGPQALRLIQHHRPQIAFMEVRLPGICGMQVARRVSPACQVVFTTHHDHYAVNAFDAGGLDYILKPISRIRLRNAVRRAKRQLSLSLDTAAGSEKKQYLQWLCTPKGRHARLISVDEVCYFKADRKYTLVAARTTETLINMTIKSLVHRLDPDRFWRIHRSTIVCVNQIEDVQRTQTGRGSVRLKNRAEVLTVSRPYLHLFKKV